MKHLEGMEHICNILFGSLHHCVVIVDEQGIITFMNERYYEFLGTSASRAVGRHVTEVIENTRMHLVVASGEAEKANMQYIRGNYMIADRVPLYNNGYIIGALGLVMFRDRKEWAEMNQHIKTLMLELESYQKKVEQLNGTSYSLHDALSVSPEMEEVKRNVRKVASSDVSVLLRGETGTGKELFAQGLHKLSERSMKPFVKVNCAAIPGDLLESELFGYEEGAFTGAKKGGKPGKFQLADQGTIFLDEIGDMPLNTQVKILRVLQEGEIEPLGAQGPRQLDVRVVAATNQPLEQLMETQQFREDLYYRINVISFTIPALRNRPEDIPLLSKFMLQKVTKRLGKRITAFDQQVLDRFLNYSWPGNVRELENTIEASVHLAEGETIQLSDLPERMADKRAAGGEWETKPLKQVLAEAEKQAIVQALKEANGEKREACALLGIGKSSLYNKIMKYGLD
ncbi:sigma-54 interaction domain-containing protein [Marinococcus halophilus]|uniref:Sigma-54-dependent Fis family transcriptional regulator n=1 Tax=Marinococcus halophilus TaxID=1371 RepID=A0A510Y9Z3_MARHA|nr:sigma 54-interacting transcriptional regulator [Marinococcus halophilus]GEK59217.1 sigma-54-dependent Fis family transcriptional regulator [Marinococcus halophilus]